VACLGHGALTAIGQDFDDAAIGLETQSQIGLAVHASMIGAIVQ
jgi:hypothetical protein